MLLFRAEGRVHVERWLKATGRERGAIVSVERLWLLAQRWYGDRLDPSWRPRTREQAQTLLTGADLTGDFWRLG